MNNRFNFFRNFIFNIFIVLFLFVVTTVVVTFVKKYWFFNNIHIFMFIFGVIFFSFLCTFITFLYQKYINKKFFDLDKKDEKDEKFITENDSPKEYLKEDKLNRRYYVEMLAKVISTSFSSEQACYIGLYGKWGDGKTTICNFLKKKIEDDYKDGSFVFIDFKPWIYPEKANLRMCFFENLSNKISDENDSELSKKLKDLSKCFALKRLNDNVGSSNPIVDCIRALYFTHYLSIESITNEIKILLKRYSKKIIIVIDDLDRLSKEEICSVIRFIKANGDLPNITYLILADEEYLASAVVDIAPSSNNYTNENGRKYLEKIIPLRFCVPHVDGNLFLDLFKEKITEILKDYGLENDFDKDENNWLLKEYLTNMRVLKLLLNAFKLKLIPYKCENPEYKFLNLNISDLIALTIIQVFEPLFYEKLPKGYFNLLECYKMFNIGMSKEWVDRYFFDDDLTKQKILETFLSEKIRMVQDKDKNGNKVYLLEQPESVDLAREYRLASRFCFKNYFMLESSCNILSQNDFKQFLDQIKNGIIPRDLIIKINESNELPLLLYFLDGYKMQNTIEFVETYVKTLIFMANGALKDVYLPEEINVVLPVNVYENISWCLYRYCKQFCLKIDFKNKYKHIGDVLISAIDEFDDIVVSSHLIMRHIKFHNLNDDDFKRQDYLILEKRHYTILCEHFLRKINSFYKSDFFVSHIDLYSIFKCWKNLLNIYKDDLYKTPFSTFCVDLSKNKDAIFKILNIYCLNRSYASSETDYSVAIDFENLISDFGEDGVKNICETLEKSKTLTEYHNKIFAVLQICLEKYHKNIKFDLEEQYSWENSERYKEILKQKKQQK